MIPPALIKRVEICLNIRCVILRNSFSPRRKLVWLEKLFSSKTSQSISQLLFRSFDASCVRLFYFTFAFSLSFFPKNKKESFLGFFIQARCSDDLRGFACANADEEIFRSNENEKHFHVSFLSSLVRKSFVQASIIKLGLKLKTISAQAITVTKPRAKERKLIHNSLAHKIDEILWEVNEAFKSGNRTEQNHKMPWANEAFDSSALCNDQKMLRKK